jgi:hypothetical protein
VFRSPVLLPFLKDGGDSFFCCSPKVDEEKLASALRTSHDELCQRAAKMSEMATEKSVALEDVKHFHAVEDDSPRYVDSRDSTMLDAMPPLRLSSIVQQGYESLNYSLDYLGWYSTEEPIKHAPYHKRMRYRFQNKLQYTAWIARLSQTLSQWCGSSCSFAVLTYSSLSTIFDPSMNWETHADIRTMSVCYSAQRVALIWSNVED